MDNERVGGLFDSPETTSKEKQQGGSFRPWIEDQTEALNISLWLRRHPNEALHRTSPGNVDNSERYYDTACRAAAAMGQLPRLRTLRVTMRAGRDEKRPAEPDGRGGVRWLDVQSLRDRQPTAIKLLDALHVALRPSLTRLQLDLLGEGVAVCGYGGMDVMHSCHVVNRLLAGLPRLVELRVRLQGICPALLALRNRPPRSLALRTLIVDLSRPSDDSELPPIGGCPGGDPLNAYLLKEHFSFVDGVRLTIVRYHSLMKDPVRVRLIVDGQEQLESSDSDLSRLWTEVQGTCDQKERGGLRYVLRDENNWVYREAYAPSNDGPGFLISI